MVFFLYSHSFMHIICIKVALFSVSFMAHGFCYAVKEIYKFKMKGRGKQLNIINGNYKYK